jgi:hypothetical protein
MVRILTGLVAAIVVAMVGFFGFQFYTQHRIASEIDTAFEQIRASGGRASHGPVSFDPKSRTVTVTDIVAESAAQPPVSVKIASLTASGVGQPDATRFSADSIEVTDVEIGAAMPAETISRVIYKLPRMTVKDFSGPLSAQRLPTSASFIELYRFGFEQLANITAASITAPDLTGTIKFNAAMPGDGGGSADFGYSGLAIESIKDGKIASVKTDNLVFTTNSPQLGKAEKLTVNVANIASYDIDVGAMAAVFDPQKANDDRYYRAYRQISAGPYILTSGQGSGQGVNMRIDGMTIDDVGIKPSRMQVPALLAMMPPAGAAPPTAAQARDMMEKVAGLYQGIRVGNAEMRGLSMQTPQGPIKLATIRFNFEGGKIGELAFEGLDAHAPKGPVKLERFALKSLDISGLMHMAAQFAGQKPSPDQALMLLPLIEGVEVKDFAAPYKNTNKRINIDTLNLNWGQFVGPIPSKVRLSAKMSAPLDTSDIGQKMLVAAGLDSAAIDLDFGTAWTETSGTIVLEPIALNLGGLLKASARVSLANVPHGVFSISTAQAAVMAAQIEAGALELTLRDMGGGDIAVAQYARSQNVSREAARSTLVDSIRASGENAAAANPDTAAAVEALARFVETPGQTLTIKLTPLGKVPALQLVQSLRTDPFAALAQFKIEASTGL